MDFDFGILFLVGWQLKLLQLCTSQTNVCSYNGDVRLVNGTGPHEGRVEICYSGEWKSVCGYPWITYNIAGPVCTQLNYPPQDALVLYGAPFGQGNGSILERAYCSGSELKLIDCRLSDYHDSYCYRGEGTGVRCLSCNTHGAVRLRGSSLEHRGRVEICVNNVWGTVCDDYWDSTDASVVCGELGFSRSGSRGYSGAPFGPGRGPIHLGNVRCTGSEQRLIDCPYTNNTFRNDCTHGQDVAVYCQPTLQCEEGDLRLTGGSTVNQGRVEVCMNETWGTICSTNWGQTEANVACRQLGFSQHGAIAQINFGFSRAHYNNILCIGREMWLIDCQRDTFTRYCYYPVRIQCSYNYLPSPLRFQVICEQSNLCTLSWQQPSIHSRGHGNISNYFINCSTLHKDARRDEWTTNVSTYAILHVQLRPYRFYNCCVAAVNEAGRGDSTCQITITHEMAPSAPPTSTEAIQLNSTSIFLSWKPPPVQYQNGIIQGYYVELNSTDVAEPPYTWSTQDQYLLLECLQPDTMYTCRVAAYTVGRGPFSEPLKIVLDSENAEEIQSGHSQGSATATVATISTLLVILVIIIGIYITVQISYKIVHRKKSTPVQNMYETVEEPQPSKAENTFDSKESSRQSQTRIAKQNVQDYRDGAVTPPLPPRTYSLSSSLDKIDNLENIQLQDMSTDQEIKDREPSENTYQPLILRGNSNTATTDGEYQSLTQFRQS